MSENNKYRYASGMVSTTSRPVEVARCHDGLCVVVTHKTLTHLFGEVVTAKLAAKDVQFTEFVGNTVYVPLNRVKSWETVLATKGNTNHKPWAPRV